MWVWYNKTIESEVQNMPNKMMTKEQVEAVCNCPYEFPGGMMCNRECALKRDNKCQFSFSMFLAWVKALMKKGE